MIHEDHAPRVLVVGPAWIGDMIMAQSLFKILRRESPRVEIDVLAPAWSLPLLDRMPEVHEALMMPLGHGELGLGKRYHLGRELARRGYTQAIVLPRSFKAALIPWFARAPRRTGYRGEARYGLINDMRALDRAGLPRMVQRYVALGLDAGAPAPVDVPRPALKMDADHAKRLMARFGLSARSPVVGFMPGAEYGPSKQWPLEYYVELAQRLGANGAQVWIFGSEKDRDTSEHIVAQAGCGINLCGRTQLADAIDLIAQVDIAVSNDSGLMHMAAAVGVPLVAIYGSSTPDYTPPLSVSASILYLKVACSPCFDRTCRYGHYRCLRAISVEAVFNEVRRWLNKGRRPDGVAHRLAPGQ